MFLRFVERVIALRTSHPVFRRGSFYRGTVQSQPWKDIAWLTAAGNEITPGDWRDPDLTLLACAFSPETGACTVLPCDESNASAGQRRSACANRKRLDIAARYLLAGWGEALHHMMDSCTVRERSLVLLVQKLVRSGAPVSHSTFRRHIDPSSGQSKTRPYWRHSARPCDSTPSGPGNSASTCSWHFTYEFIVRKQHVVIAAPQQRIDHRNEQIGILWREIAAADHVQRLTEGIIRVDRCPWDRNPRPAAS